MINDNLKFREILLDSKNVLKISIQDYKFLIHNENFLE